MNPESLAVLAAFAFAFFYLFSRVAVQYASAFSVNLWANGICAIGLSLFLPFAAIPDSFPAAALMDFVVAGVASPALAALFIILGSRRIGISRTGAVAAGLGPLLSSTVGVLYLGETPSGRVIAGTLLIVLGIVALSFEKSHWGRTWRFLGYPILGAVCLALTAVFRKLGLQAAPAPVFGAAVQSWAGLVFLILLAPLIPTGERFRWERAALPYLLLGGLFVTLSLYFYFRALETGDITVVTPLAHTWPLLVVLLSRGFLQRIEHITPRTMLSTVFVVGGGFMVMS